MSSFEQRYYLGQATRMQRIRRDLGLCMESLSFLFLWLTRGAKVRRAYREAQRSGKPLALEDLFEDPS